MIAQTPWFERQFHFDFPLSHFPVIFSRLQGTLFRLQCMLATASEDACSHRVQGWSVKEHLGHLSDMESLWWLRVQDFLHGKPVLTIADLNNTRTNEAGHNAKPLEELLQTFQAERQRLLKTVSGFDESSLAILSLHPRLQQPMRLIDSLFFVAEHDDHHLAKINGQAGQLPSAITG